MLRGCIVFASRVAVIVLISGYCFGSMEDEMNQFDRARSLITRFKGDTYLNGFNVLSRIGNSAAGLGNCVALVCDSFPDQPSTRRRSGDR